MAVALLCACSEEDAIQDNPKEPTFLTTANLEFSGTDDAAQEISFDAPAPWTIELHHPGTVWLQASRYSGKAGKSSIRLTPISDNNGFTTRTATLEIFVDGYTPYLVVIKQKPGASYNVSLSGHIDNGVMELGANESGTLFSDTLFICSNTNWSLVCDDNSLSVLSFQLSEQPLQGVSKDIRVVVSADYSKFPSSRFEGAFSVVCPDGSKQKVRVSAAAQLGVFQQAEPSDGEAGRTSYALVDSVQRGVFSTTFYVESNVRWSIKNVPAWLESQADWSGNSLALTNVGTSGSIVAGRQRVALRIKSEMLSTMARSEQLAITDAADRVLATVGLSFAGLDQNYIDYSIRVPATDAVGNPWMFESSRATIEEEGADNRKRIELPFEVMTAVDYSRIDEAPFHLLMVDATNGIAHQKEMHWMTLRMGEEQSQTEAGLFVKQFYLTANERGDADDLAKITDATRERNAFIYIVPKSLGFDDLWTAEGKLKEVYAEDLVLIGQKNDPNGVYTFGLEEVANGDTISVKPEGESQTFHVTPGSYTKCFVNFELKNSEGEWNPAGEICSMSFTADESDDAKTLTFSFSSNTAKKNPFTGQTTGADRLIRISVQAFLGDDAGMRSIYTFYVYQKLMEQK